MRIDILFRPPMRVWQLQLGDALQASRHQIRFVAGPRSKPKRLFVEKAMQLERRLYGSAPALFDIVTDVPSGAGDDADLVIALDGEATLAKRALVPFFDDVAGEAALLDAIARSLTPRVDLRLTTDGAEETLVQALLAVENRDAFTRALDQVLARLVSLVRQAVRRFEEGASEAEASLSAPAKKTRKGPLSFMAQGLGRKVARRMPGAARGPNHWRIGFRRPADAGVAGERRWGDTHFELLPDDRRRFCADPMPFEHEGRAYLFFEDFLYASGKGTIGMVEIMPDGSMSDPRTVLEQSVHLSYPLILRHGGDIYMLPEMSTAGRIQLFRAERFPDRWVPDLVLLDGIVASDATPILYEGRWWLFATLSDDGGSTWDQLGLFHAPDLLGPWRAHADNPVLVDAGAARPAGAMWVESGHLMRVAQDCRGGYGVGLAICRIDRLDDAGFAQSVVARLGPPSGYGADGVHTLNRAGTLEAIDLRFPAL